MRSFDVLNRYNYADRYNPIAYVIGNIIIFKYKVANIANIANIALGWRKEVYISRLADLAKMTPG